MRACLRRGPQLTSATKDSKAKTRINPNKKSLILIRLEIVGTFANTASRLYRSRRQAKDQLAVGKFHDLGDAKCIVIRGQLRGHNDTPFGRPTPCRLISRPVDGCRQGVFGVFSYY
jgi:hypothetical protein